MLDVPAAPRHRRPTLPLRYLAQLSLGRQILRYLIAMLKRVLPSTSSTSQGSSAAASRSGGELASGA
jgi:hypothetical protein